MRSLLIRSTAGCLEEGRMLSRMAFRSTESTQDIPGNGRGRPGGSKELKYCSRTWHLAYLPLSLLFLMFLFLWVLISALDQVSEGLE